MPVLGVRLNLNPDLPTGVLGDTAYVTPNVNFRQFLRITLSLSLSLSLSLTLSFSDSVTAASSGGAIKFGSRPTSVY